MLGFETSDVLWAIFVVVMFGISAYLGRKPATVDAEGKVTGGGVDMAELAELAVRAARAIFTKGADMDAVNAERFAYALNGLKKLIPWLNEDQLEMLIEGAWDRVKAMDVTVTLPELEVVTDATVAEEDVPFAGRGAYEHLRA